MRQEFKVALVRDTDLDIVKADLLASLERDHKRAMQAVERDYTMSKLILAGLKEPINCEAHKMADSFLKDYRRTHGKRENLSAKDDETLRRLMEDPLIIDEEGKGAEDGKSNDHE